LVHLARRGRGPLPWTRLNVGSPVVLSPHTAKVEQPHRGVICERDEQSICAALDRLPEDLADHETWRLDLSFDEVAVARQRAALEQAKHLHGNRSAILRDVLLGQRQPEFGVDPQVRPLDRNLNAVQREAVQFAFSARDVALIHGPPGTGKTTVIVEVIRQAVRRGRKVLVSAPSNLAVDNLFERLLGFGERVVRLGHPARVLPALREHTLDLLVERHQDVRLARKFVKQALSLFREADRHTRAAPKPGARRQLREDAKSLLADARRLEMQAVDSILDSASVLCATTTGLDSQVLGARHFDLAVIDEACQSTEPGCWLPLLRCDRVVLAGDHCQLPPTVVSQEAAAEGFSVSLFERLMALYGRPIAQRLTVQYRMHEAIMGFSSTEFYDGALEADPSVGRHLLAELPGVKDALPTRSPVEFIDTAGAGFDEEMEPDGESRLNRQEAELARRKVQELLDCGVRPADIAVIAPYAAQVRLLRERLAVPGLEIDSVDGFQGREKEAVVISLVRSNPKGEIGFLRDVRRINVALTRAKRKLLVIGDSATLAGEPFYQRMIEYFESLGAYKTVWDESPET
jgi:superfamily I DNA and/or RNA helicase